MDANYEVNVTSLDAEHRRALEDVIGTPLRENQRLTINVTEVDGASAAISSGREQSINDWTKVYDGLTDEEIEAIDCEINTRANLSRNFP